MRPTAMRVQAVLGLLLVVAVTGCTDKAEDRQVGPLRYDVTYEPGGYEASQAQPRFDACASLPGASFAGGEDTLPPNLFIRFAGTTAEQRELVRCLEGLPGAQFSSAPETRSDGG